MPGRTTTALHTINADRLLGTSGKIAYFLCNWLNNLFPYRDLDPRLAILDFTCPGVEGLLRRLSQGASPSRKLSDLFWMTLPWDRIEEELGTIHVLDIGCGSGEYGLRLLSWSSSRIASYVGVDIHAQDRWHTLAAGDQRLRFIHAPVLNIRSLIPRGVNMIISQSSIEHVDADLRMFEEIRDYAHECGHDVVQVHLCPSQACLRLYLLHGSRQYTPRTLSKITRLHDDAHRLWLFRLGGSACNRLHYEFITKPRFRNPNTDCRVTKTLEYEHRAFHAIIDDMAHPSRSPAFYALVMQARPRLVLF